MSHLLICNGRVVNWITVEDGKYEPPDGHVVVPYPSGHWGVGWVWDGTTAIDPDPKPPTQPETRR